MNIKPAAIPVEHMSVHLTQVTVTPYTCRVVVGNSNPLKKYNISRPPTNDGRGADHILQYISHGSVMLGGTGREPLYWQATSRGTIILNP